MFAGRTAPVETSPHEKTLPLLRIIINKTVRLASGPHTLDDISGECSRSGEQQVDGADNRDGDQPREDMLDRESVPVAPHFPHNCKSKQVTSGAGQHTTRTARPERHHRPNDEDDRIDVDHWDQELQVVRTTGWRPEIR